MAALGTKMNTPKDPVEATSPQLFSDSLQFREFDADTAAAELRVRIPEVEAELEKLEQAQVVTNEALLLEFSI